MDFLLLLLLDFVNLYILVQRVTGKLRIIAKEGFACICHDG